MSCPLVSCIVLNYRRPQLAVRCVQALLKQSIADNIEIIVVDNHSLDDSIGVLRNRVGTLPQVRIVESAKNTGYGTGNNYGAHYACGEFILVINDDNTLEQKGLEHMVHAMQSDPSIGILAPKLVFDDGTVRESARSFPSVVDIFLNRTPLKRFFRKRLDRYLQQDLWGEEGPRETDWVAGACFLMRRDLFEELGGFDERFFFFFEDTDLCRRCRALGKNVVLFPDVQATDQKERLSGGGFLSILFSRMGWIHVESAWKYFWKWGGC